MMDRMGLGVVYHVAKLIGESDSEHRGTRVRPLPSTSTSSRRATSGSRRPGLLPLPDPAFASQDSSDANRSPRAHQPHCPRDRGESLRPDRPRGPGSSGSPMPTIRPARPGPPRRRGVRRRARSRHGQRRVDRRQPGSSSTTGCLRADRSSVEMYSPFRSRVYLFHLVPVAAAVRWTLDVTPKADTASDLACTVQVDLPPALGVLARLSLLGPFLGRHVDEEVRGFAADLRSKRERAPSVYPLSRGNANDQARAQTRLEPS